MTVLNQYNASLRDVEWQYSQDLALLEDCDEQKKSGRIMGRMVTRMWMQQLHLGSHEYVYGWYDSEVDDPTSTEDGEKVS